MPIYEFYKNITFYSIKNIKKNILLIDDLHITEYKNFRIEIKNKTNKNILLKITKAYINFCIR